MPNQPNNPSNSFFPHTIHPVGYCAKCGHTHVQLVFNNNPIIGAPTVCYDCVATTLDVHNLNHADLFCRTYNFPFDPEAWMAIMDDPSNPSPASALKTYVEAALAEKANQPNLAYGSATNDLWKRTTEEWKKCRDFAAILDRIEPIRDSYTKRSGMKWGEHYTFTELLKLDSIYVRTLRANNITNPLQQEAVRTLCKLLIEMDQAIAAKDAKAIKDFSDAWAKFAKQANLETMINESRTEDIVTMSELASYLEERNFMPSFYDNNPRDEVDRTIADLQDTQRRLIMESLSLQPVWEDTVKRYERTQEDEYAGRAAEENSLERVLNFDPEEAAKPEVESDTEVTNADFSTDEASPALGPLTIQRDPRRKLSGGDDHE